ncbi:MAG: hypothetical protein ACQESP_09125 [Candidatus Muiribacteriota bacterium]
MEIKDLNYIKLYTKYSILNNNTKKLTFLKELSNLKIPRKKHDEMNKFYDKILELESENKQIFKVVKKIKEDLSKEYNFSDIMKEVKGKNKEQEEDNKEKKEDREPSISSYEVEQAYSLLKLNRELAEEFREKIIDPFFENIPFLNYLRRDFREMLKNIIKIKPYCAFISTRNPDVVSIYNLKRSVDLLTLNGLSKFNLKKSIENYYYNILVGIEPEHLYILTIFSKDSFFIIARPPGQTKTYRYFNISYDFIQDYFMADGKYCFKLKNEKMVIFQYMPPELKEKIKNLIKRYNFIKKQKVDYFKLEGKKLNTLHKSGILNSDDYENKIMQLKDLRKNIFNPQNIDALIKNTKIIKEKVSGFHQELKKEFGKDLAIMYIYIYSFSEKVDNQRIISMIKTNTSLFEGNLIKKIGDGLLCVFEKTDKLIQCSQSIFEDLKSMNENSGDEHKINLKIVASYGNVFVNNKDIFGSDINLICRIEKEASAGEFICTESFLQNLSNKTDFILICQKKFEGFRDNYKIYKKV